MKHLRKLAMYNLDWQVIRIKMLEFNTLRNCADNLIVLNDYVAGSSSTSQKIIRLWRVINLLNATRMGFHGCGYVGTQMDNLLVAHRTIFQEMNDSLLKHMRITLEEVTKDNQNNVTAIALLKKSEPSIFIELLNDLKKRFSNGTAETRAQLREFIEMMD